MKKQSNLSGSHHRAHNSAQELILDDRPVEMAAIYGLDEF